MEKKFGELSKPMQQSADQYRQMFFKHNIEIMKDNDAQIKSSWYTKPDPEILETEHHTFHKRTYVRANN